MFGVERGLPDLSRQPTGAAGDRFIQQRNPDRRQIQALVEPTIEPPPQCIPPGHTLFAHFYEVHLLEEGVRAGAEPHGGLGLLGRSTNPPHPILIDQEMHLPKPAIQVHSLPGIAGGSPYRSDTKDLGGWGRTGGYYDFGKGMGGRNPSVLGKQAASHFSYVLICKAAVLIAFRVQGH